MAAFSRKSCRTKCNTCLLSLKKKKSTGNWLMQTTACSMKRNRIRALQVTAFSMFNSDIMQTIAFRIGLLLAWGLKMPQTFPVFCWLSALLRKKKEKKKSIPAMETRGRNQIKTQKAETLNQVKQNVHNFQLSVNLFSKQWMDTICSKWEECNDEVGLCINYYVLLEKQAYPENLHVLYWLIKLKLKVLQLLNILCVWAKCAELAFL